MYIVSLIVVALAYGIALMVTLHRSADGWEGRLSDALLQTVVLALVGAMMFVAGMAIGRLLRIDGAEADLFAKQNAYIGLGLMILVAIRVLWPYLGKRTTPPQVEMGLSRMSVMFGFAWGVNVMLTGMGMGFAMGRDNSVWWSLLPMVVLLTVGGFYGVMLGHRGVAIRKRRWMGMAFLLLVGVAVAAVINA